MRRPIVTLATFLALAFPVPAVPQNAPANSACSLDRATGTTIDHTPFITGGDAASWNVEAGRVAFMKPDDTGYYRVNTMRPDGSDVRPIDAGLPKIPRKHQGTTSWYASGRLLMFTAQKAEWSGRRLFGIPDYEALPGFGRHDDIWVASLDGRGAWKLTNEPNTKDEGVLIPVFSRDGSHVAWSARQPGGTYELRVAQFAAEPQPHLLNVRTYKPGGDVYYETGSFTSDGKSLVYTSDQDTHQFFRSQIYRLDLATGRSERLTTGNDYDEHPIAVATPSGEWVVYMSSRGVDRYRGHILLGTDWWAMRIDGSGTKRLTTMNVNHPGNPESEGTMQVAGRMSPTPESDVYLGGAQDSLVKQTGNVKRIHLTCE